VVGFKVWFSRAVLCNLLVSAPSLLLTSFVREFTQWWSYRSLGVLRTYIYLKIYIDIAFGFLKTIKRNFKENFKKLLLKNILVSKNTLVKHVLTFEGFIFWGLWLM
jgi:hypothetical protein